MQHKTKLKLATVHQLADKEEWSTEKMLQVMQDTCKVDLDTCIAYLKLNDIETNKLFEQVNSVLEVVLKLNEMSI